MTPLDDRWEQATRLIVPLVWAAHLVLIWAYRFVPSTDYPEWLLQAQILARHGDPSYGFATWYAIIHAPVPNGGFVLPAAVLAQFVPIEVAGKIILSAYVLWFPLAVRSYVSAIGGKSSVWMFSILLLFNMSFVNGNIAFLIGTCILFQLLGEHEHRGAGPTRLRILGDLLLTVALFLSHAICAAAYLLFLTIRLSDQHRSTFDKVTDAVKAATLIGLASWYYGARPGDRMNIGVDWGVDARYRISALTKSFIGGISFPPYDFSLPTSLANAFVFIFAAWAVVLALRLVVQRWSSSPYARFTVLLLGITLVAPRLILGIGEPSQRLALVLFVALLGFLPPGHHVTGMLRGSLLILAVFVTIVRWQDISRANDMLKARYEFLRPLLPSGRPLATLDDNLGKDEIPFYHLVPKGISLIFQTDYFLLSGGYNPWSFRTGYLIPRTDFSGLADSMSAAAHRGEQLALKGSDVPSWTDYIVLDWSSPWGRKIIDALRPYFSPEAEREIAHGIHTVVLRRVRR